MGDMDHEQQCPHCGRWLRPVKRGIFKIPCWPRHMLAVYSGTNSADANARYQASRYENQYALADNEMPCPMSGTPIEL